MTEVDKGMSYVMSDLVHSLPHLLKAIFFHFKVMPFFLGETAQIMRHDHFHRCFRMLQISLSPLCLMMKTFFAWQLNLLLHCKHSHHLRMVVFAVQIQR
jgi:hypothetical protein